MVSGLCRAVVSFLGFIARRLGLLFLDLWHGSVKWGWFAVLILGALAMIGVDEYAGAYFVAALGIISAASNFWHWAQEKKGLRKIRHGVFLLIPVSLILLFFWVGDVKGNKSWSPSPKAWDKMMVASTIRLETICTNPRVWPPIGVPWPISTGLNAPPPAHQPNKNVLLKNISFSGSFRAGGNVTTTYTVGTKSATDFEVNVYSYCAIGYTFPDDMSKQREAARNFWEKAEESKDFSQGLIRSSMTWNVVVSSLPLPESFIDPLNNGEMAAYYFLKIKDPKTNRVLLDICTFDNAKTTNGECDELARPHPQ